MLLKDKNGAIHVDWAVSMGLFLIYITILFILIKPGYYAEHKPESLFTLIEDNLVKSISIELKEVQFVGKCSANEEIVLEDLNGDYKFSKLVDKDGNELTAQPHTGFYAGDKIRIICREIQSFDLEKQIYFATAYPKDHLVFNNPEVFPDFKITCTDNTAQSCRNKVYLGVSTSYIGFSEDYLNQLKQISYNTILDTWGFPLNKNFNITVYNLNKNNFISINNNAQRIEGIDIFVKEFNWIYLDNSNNREEIKVHIDVW